MGLLANLVESYQDHENKQRIEAGLKPLKFSREEKAWEKEARIKADLPVNVNSQTKLKILRLSKDAQKDIARYRHIFKNSPEIVEMYVDKLTTASSQEELVEANEFLKSRKNINLYADKKDFTKWSDLTFYGKQRWDMIYRPETKEGKKAFRKFRSIPIVQLATGVSVGTYNALAGTAELAAALSDVSGLSDDMIGKVEKALPAIDLMDVYGESRGSIAKMTSVLVQYG